VSRDSVLWRIVGGRFSGVKSPEAPKPIVNLGHLLKGKHETYISAHHQFNVQQFERKCAWRLKTPEAQSSGGDPRYWLLEECES